MITRPFWINIIEEAWKRRSLIWLSGVRRSGKTTLAKMFENAVFMNCDLPSVQRKLEDPESFYQGIPMDGIVIFDEIHRLTDPSILLKIGTDEFPKVKILATGSSTLEATKKFRDSLTGRKTILYLPPILWDECIDPFHLPDLDYRLLHGGLPEPFLSGIPESVFFSEWMDSFYARDIEELFNVRNRAGYLRLMQLLLRSSGGLIEQTNLSRSSDLSRPTVISYLESMRIANAVFLLAPFHGGSKREITKQPKCYAFDTGVVAFMKGWNDIREEDRGILWEHLVLDILRTCYPSDELFYWHDKSNREIDFVVRHPGNNIDTFECKINPDNLSVSSLEEFRKLYPKGKNYCFTPFIIKSYSKKIKGYEVKFVGKAEHLLTLPPDI